METEVVTTAIAWLVTVYSHGDRLKESFVKSTGGMLHREIPTHKLSSMYLTWIYCPGYKGVHGNLLVNEMARQALMHGMLRLGKSYISEAVMDKFCVDEKLEWENNH